jgi:hypothetical protein
MLCIILFINGGIYWFLERLLHLPPNRNLVFLHLTLLLIGFFWFIQLTQITDFTISNYFKARSNFRSAVLLIILAHLLIPFNLIFTLIKKQK